MKKILVLFISLLFVTLAQAGEIKKIVFFGDSLTDDGYLYKLLLKILPKSPPYFEGRFSNGYTWAEFVGKHYYEKNYMSYKIYALGGATAVFHIPTTKFISPTTLDLEVDKYLLDALLQDKSQVLFSIWIGGNDYMFDPDADPEQLTQKVVDRIVWAIKTLAYYGGKQFLILNLPDLSKTPYAQEMGPVEKLHLFTQLHNQKLSAAIADLKKSHPDLHITFFNSYDTFNDVIANPEKYNEKYNIHITNTTEACWKGGYIFKQLTTTQNLDNEIKQTLTASKSALPNDVDVHAMSQFILNTPILAYTYAMSKSYEAGIVPCENANEYLFWDSIHPTETIHQVLAKMIIESLGNVV